MGLSDEINVLSFLRLQIRTIRNSTYVFMGGLNFKHLCEGIGRWDRVYSFIVNKN